VQEHIAKTDFLKLIEATIKKLHSVEGLDEAEKTELKTKIYDRRTSFGDRVMTWIGEVGDESMAIYDALETDLCMIKDEFEEDVKTTPTPTLVTDPPASVINWLSQHYAELLEVV